MADEIQLITCCQAKTICQLKLSKKAPCFADMVVEYGQTEMDITICVTELGCGAHTPAAGPIRGTDNTSNMMKVLHTPLTDMKKLVACSVGDVGEIDCLDHHLLSGSFLILLKGILSPRENF
jgi:hypothetical protein